MKKCIEIDWLQNVDTIQRNELFPYISNSKDVSNNCDQDLDLYYYIEGPSKSELIPILFNM